MNKNIPHILLQVALGVGSYFLMRELLQSLSPEMRVRVYAGVFAGFLVGLVPLLMANKRGLKQLGVWALMCCVVAGGLLGLILALPVAIIFAMVIRKNRAVAS